MSDFAPVDGRAVWSSGVTGTGARARGSAIEVLSRPRVDAPGGEQSSGAAARRIVDEVELSDAALSAQRPAREEIIARARERIASGFYDQQGVIDQTIDRLPRGLVG
jgi:hypothetical protein